MLTILSRVAPEIFFYMFDVFFAPILHYQWSEGYLTSAAD